MAAAEVASPRRRREIPRVLRWTNNLALVVARHRGPAPRLPGARGRLSRAIAEARGFGLFNFVEAPAWLAVLASIVILDLVIYLQHVLFHAVPGLWRLHRVHHADLEIDVTTGPALPPDRDPALDGDQARRGGGPRRPAAWPCCCSR
ncbi:MAG: hypothetical protein KatS3mg117_2240 [Geminicoccaceae bacterium]|nr:MAG: hypothetical protein KatS3mg117_2240 [Geminicoccaceae bacterium]